MPEPLILDPATEKKVAADPTSACGGDVSAELGGDALSALEKTPEQAMHDSAMDNLASAADGMDENDLMAGIAGLSDEADLDLLNSTPDFSVDTDDFSNIKEPHWLFDTSTLFEKLKSLTVIVKDRQELVAKCILLQPATGYVTFKVNTGDAQVEVKVDVLNTTNSLDKSFVLDWKTLFSSIKNSGAKFLFHERDGNPIVSCLGGDIDFENFNVKNELYDHEEFKGNDGYSKLEGGLFHRFVLRASASMALSQRPEDRRVCVEEGMAFSNFMNCIFVQKEVQAQNIGLRSTDLQFLGRMFDGAPEVKYKETEKEHIFSTTWAKVILPKIDTADIAPIKKVIEEFKQEWEFTASPGHLYKVFTMVRDMLGCTGIVKLLPQDGKLTVTATTRTGKKLKFPITSSPEGAEFSVSSPIASLVSTALMYRKDPAVTIGIDRANRMSFDGEGVRVIYGSTQ